MTEVLWSSRFRHMTTSINERHLPAAEHTGARINQLLWERRITKTQAALVVGVNQSTFSKKLRGYVPITVDELVAIATLLGVEPRDLLPTVGELYAIRDSNPEPADWESPVSLRLVVAWPNLDNATLSADRPAGRPRHLRLVAAS